MALLLLVCLPFCAVSRLFGSDAYWIRLYLRSVGWLLGLRVTVQGQPVRGGALYASNHISWLDIPAIGGRVPARFIAKSEIADWPLIGWLARIGDTVFVARQRRSETRRQADEVQVALTGGRPIVLFAEGGTGDGLTLEPFRASLFAAASEAGTMVQPVAVDYGSRAAEIAWPRGASFSNELLRMLNRPAPVPVTLHFPQGLDGGSTDRKRLAFETHAAVARALRLG